MSEITFKTITFNKENFLNVINPDTMVAETQGFISYNTGIYGSKTDNAFPNFCIDLYTNSASAHQNLVNLKASLILGNNLQAEDQNLQSEVEPFLAKRNKSGLNLKGSYKMWCKDFALFNACVAQVVFNREGQIAEVYHVPTQNFRLGTANKYGQIEYGYLSNNWGVINNSRVSKNANKDHVKIRMFDPTNWKKHPVQLMYIRDYSYDLYAVPSYSAAINWLLISREISEFHKNNIRSNFFLSGLLTQKKGGMSDEQLEENAQAIEKFYAGGKGRKVLLAYVDDLVNDAPKFETFTGQEQDKVFDILNQQAFQEIVTAHNAYDILAGVSGKGQDLGGDANKLITAVASFSSLVTDCYKQVILDNLNRIMEVNQLPALTSYTDLPKVTLPQQQAQDTTVSERRAILFGLPELTSTGQNSANNNNQINAG